MFGSYTQISNGKARRIKYVTLFGNRYVYSGAPWSMPRLSLPKLTYRTRYLWRLRFRFLGKLFVSGTSIAVIVYVVVNLLKG